MAACHIKNGNWKRAVETADKVLPYFLFIVCVCSLDVYYRLLQRTPRTLRPCSGRERRSEKWDFSKRQIRFFQTCLLRTQQVRKARDVCISLGLIVCSDAPRIKAELERLRAMDKEREKKHNQKFRGG